MSTGSASSMFDWQSKKSAIASGVELPELGRDVATENGMAQLSALLIALTLVVSPLGLTSSRAAGDGDKDKKVKAKSDKPERALNSKERLAFIRKARVWESTD